MAQQTLWWLGTRPWIVLPLSTSSSGVDAVVEKLVSRRRGTKEMSTVSSMKSTVSSTVNEESDDTEETIVDQWRSGPTVTHLVTEPVEWSTPAAVTVVSIVDHTNQESVCTALFGEETTEELLPLVGTRPRTRTRRERANECHAAARHEL